MKKKLIISVLVLCNMVLVVGSVFATKSGNVKNTNVFLENERYNQIIQDKIPKTSLSKKVVSIEKFQIAEELKFAERPVKIDKAQMEEKILYVEEEETLPVDAQQVTLPVNDQQ